MTEAPGCFSTTSRLNWPSSPAPSGSSGAPGRLVAGPGRHGVGATQQAVAEVRVAAQEAGRHRSTTPSRASSVHRVGRASARCGSRVLRTSSAFPGLQRRLSSSSETSRTGRSARGPATPRQMPPPPPSNRAASRAVTGDGGGIGGPAGTTKRSSGGAFSRKDESPRRARFASAYRQGRPPQNCALKSGTVDGLGSIASPSPPSSDPTVQCLTPCYKFPGDRPGPRGHGCDIARVREEYDSAREDWLKKLVCAGRHGGPAAARSLGLDPDRARHPHRPYRGAEQDAPVAEPGPPGDLPDRRLHQPDRRPVGRNSTRPPLTPEQIKANAETYYKQGQPGAGPGENRDPLQQRMEPATGLRGLIQLAAVGTRWRG